MNFKNMPNGIIIYNEEGQPQCEICGKYFNRVISHVRQKHDMNEREYKIMFGFDLHKGICSKDSSEKTREKTLSNYDRCISKNLIANGSNTRFQIGDDGRTKDKVSKQTRIALKERLKEPEMVKAMKSSGERVGKSGLRNKKRWCK
jgi:hypothetical protein